MCLDGIPDAATARGSAMPCDDGICETSALLMAVAFTSDLPTDRRGRIAGPRAASLRQRTYEIAIA